MSSGAGAAPPPPQITVRYADILFARNVPDPQGQNPKDRRVVVLTPDAALQAGFPIVAAAITGSLNPLTADHVLLPFKNPPGTPHPKTGLTRRAAVLCTWLVIVHPDDVAGRSGFAPAAYMSQVEQRVGTTGQTMGGWP